MIYVKIVSVNEIQLAKGGKNMLRTWEFGTIRIVKSVTIFDAYIRDDVLGQYSYYQLAEDGEIVAVDNWKTK